MPDAPLEPTVALYALCYSHEAAAKKEVKFREIARQDGVEDVEIYFDIGVSGELELPDRPGGKRLLEAITNGYVAQVFVFTLDDFGETLDVILNASKFIQLHGAEVMVSKDFFGDNPPT